MESGVLRRRCLAFSEPPFPPQSDGQSDWDVVNIHYRPWLDLSSLLYAPFQNFPRGANVSQRNLL